MPTPSGGQNNWPNWWGYCEALGARVRGSWPLVESLGLRVSFQRSSLPCPRVKCEVTSFESLLSQIQSDWLTAFRELNTVLLPEPPTMAREMTDEESLWAGTGPTLSTSHLKLLKWRWFLNLCIKFSFQIYSLGWVFQLNISQASSIHKSWLLFTYLPSLVVILLCFILDNVAGAQWTNVIKATLHLLSLPSLSWAVKAARIAIFLKSTNSVTTVCWKHKLAPIFRGEHLTLLPYSRIKASVLYSH